MGQDVPQHWAMNEWKGHALDITGDNDKQGFPVKRGVLSPGRVCLLLSKNYSCYLQRCAGENEGKLFRGCIVNGNLSVISMAIVKRGDEEIPGLTDKMIHRRLGP
jgi:small subunit ribosomal protein S6e